MSTDNINDLTLKLIHRSSNNAKTQNQAQYALQELLKVLQCTLNAQRGVRNWAQFSEDMEDLLSPCLRSTWPSSTADAATQCAACA